MQRYFWLVVLFAIALSYFWPGPGLVMKPYLTYILMLMMTLSCLKIDPRSFSDLSQTWWRYLVVLVFIFVIPVVVVFLCKNLVNSEVFVGLIVAAAVPSAVSVVFISDLLGGESPKALIATTLAHLVSPLVTPFLVWLFARQIIQVGFGSMLILIIKLVILPMLVAQVIRRLKINNLISAYVPNVNTFLLFILIWGIIAPGKKLLLDNYHQFLWALLIVVIVLLVEMAVSVWFGRSKSEKMTWVVVDTYKNFTLASVIAWSMFGPLALLGAVAYGIVNNALIAPLQWWSNGTHKNKQ